MPDLRRRRPEAEIIDFVDTLTCDSKGLNVNTKEKVRSDVLWVESVHCDSLAGGKLLR